MCGITGAIVKTEIGKKWLSYIPHATEMLIHRGPDATNIYRDDFISLGHCRLTIIELSERANQPMTDETKQYSINYNGEVFNYLELRKNLESRGVRFHTRSDTEVLLQLYIHYGEEMLHQLNGFFALAIYDHKNKSCFVARDRFGVKPLVFYEDENCVLFASELKALLQFPLKRSIDRVSLYQYLQLNYIPAPHTIFQNIKKLQPGHYLLYKNQKLEIQQYYSLPESPELKSSMDDYSLQQKELTHLLEDAVKIRLMSDVPLGAFLSGGIDSSIICGLAARHCEKLKTFSIGYDEEPFFDETKYTRMVSKHFATDHTEFRLSRNDLHESVESVLDYLDEPFGDSSALPFFILSKLTRKHVKVALSGDGADELLGGYNKHIAEYRARNAGATEILVNSLKPVFAILPKSRANAFSNRIRQLHRFTDGMNLSDQQRYWKWCCIASETEAAALLNNTAQNDTESSVVRKKQMTRFMNGNGNLNTVLKNDVSLVLANDMLMKVDAMSMSNGLEVRTPFLDYRVAEFALSIPPEHKANRKGGKKILYDAFRNFLPEKLYHRQKHGFEVPLTGLLTHELKAKVDGLISEKFIRDQNILNFQSVNNLKDQLESTDPQDSAARIWGLIAFQHWWKKWMS